MTKDEFLKKHDLTEADYRNLQRFEEVRQSGQTNMYDYLIQMITYNLNGGERLADWTAKAGNYGEFLSTLEKEKTMRLEDVNQKLKDLEEVKQEYDFSFELPNYGIKDIENDLNAIERLKKECELTIKVLREYSKTLF